MARDAMTSAPAAFGRLSWMIVGPLALAIFAISITSCHDGWLSPLFDLIYFVVVGGMLLGRWTEFRYAQLMIKVTGELATVGALCAGIPWASARFGRHSFAANLVGNQAIRILH